MSDIYTLTRHFDLSEPLIVGPDTDAETVKRWYAARYDVNDTELLIEELVASLGSRPVAAGMTASLLGITVEERRPQWQASATPESPRSGAPATPLP